MLVHRKKKLENKERGSLGNHWNNRENIEKVEGSGFGLEKWSIWKGRRSTRARKQDRLQAERKHDQLMEKVQSRLGAFRIHRDKGKKAEYIQGSQALEKC